MRGVISLFPPYSTLAGSRSLDWELAEGGTLDDLLGELRGRYPAMADALEVVLASVNDRYAAGSQGLHDGDEVTLFPPVGGGCPLLRE